MFPHQFVYLYSSLECDSIGHLADDVLTTPLPLHHAAALHIVTCSALQVGAVAHLKSRFSASAYWDEVAADGATFGIIFGPMAAILMKTAPTAPAHRMRRMFCVPFPPGGEEFERRFGVRLLWQGYGMTEIMPHPMSAEVEPGVPYDTLGHPVSWMEYGAVDEHDRLLAPGQTGQLVYRSLLPDAMAREYYRAPEATVEAFRNFMFHTGDLGYVDEQGRVHYLGRAQDRIRRHGRTSRRSSSSSSPPRTPTCSRPRPTASPPNSASTRSSSTSCCAMGPSRSRSCISGSSRAAAPHGAALSRVAPRTPEDPEREGREVQARRRRRRRAAEPPRLRPAAAMNEVAAPFARAPGAHAAPPGIQPNGW